jgi:hypothetical protein
MNGIGQASTGSQAEARMALLQGGYDVVTGLWPIFHLRSFEAVTGPKPEGWLVKTVGALITVMGGTLLSAGLRGRVTPEVRLLGVGSAAAFTLVDIIYTAKRRISPVYLLDAVAEVALIAGWGVAYARSRGRAQQGVTSSRLAWETAQVPVPMADAAGLEQPMP